MTELIETIYCNICQKPLDDARAKRMTSVCSEACKDKLDALRLRQKAAKRCPKCLHPSTPEEREAFRLWRAERGDVHSAAAVVRDSTLPNRRAMASVLRRAAHGLRHTNVLGREELATLIAEAEALLATPEGRKRPKERLEDAEAHPEASDAPTVDSGPGTGIPANVATVESPEVNLEAGIWQIDPA